MNRFESCRSAIPVPVLDESPEFLELYWKAWELAAEHIINLPGMPQTPYMDEGFCDCDIWIWDTCFMSLFCKYAQSSFPGIESFNNFYRVLYGEEQLPVIITKNAPVWTGEVVGQPARIRIHLLDNPPLFSWAEHQNLLVSGDQDHLLTLMEKRYLQQHFFRLESLKTHESDPRLRAETWMVKHPLGYFWEGGRSGMDNTPRGRIGEHALVDRPNNPDMLWIDAIAQQGLNALEIARLAKLADDEAQYAEWMARYRHFRETINRHYWDERTGFYYDIHAKTHEFMRVMTPASFWPLVAEMATQEQAERMAAELENPETLGGAVPCISLARNDSDFMEDGRYWRGSLWIPTAYVAIKGIGKYGMHTLARSLSRRILQHMSRTFVEFEPHTIWECYNPNRSIPALTCDPVPQLVRRDFCGWSALAPISLLIEDVIGIHSVDAFERRLEWNLPETFRGRIGVTNFRFGDIVTALVCENGVCSISSNRPYSLILNGICHTIPGGESRIAVSGGVPVAEPACG